MNQPGHAGRGPDRAAALAQYRRRARIYDLELALFERIRRQAIARLALKPADIVLDVGCGTGLSLPLLRRSVGTKGRIVGVEQSPEMISKARERIATQQWKNVSLVCSPVETADIPGAANAALFHFTHDILLRPEAIANVIRHLKPGARVVACGLKWAPAWALPANLLVLSAALRSVTSLQGLDKPWSGLVKYLGPMDVESIWAGGVYIASGRVPEGADRWDAKVTGAVIGGPTR